MSASEGELRRKYDAQWSPAKYLEEYICKESPWESRMISMLHETIQSGAVSGPRGIDIGCGPTVHRISILGRVCDEIVGCDYTQSNLTFLQDWLKADSVGILNESLQFVSHLEEHQDVFAGTKELCDRVRSKLKHVVPCDVTSEESVLSMLQYGGQYDCALSNGCLESACLTYDTYVQTLKNIARIVKTGGAFILSGYLTASHYTVNDVTFECMKWREEDVKKGLEEAGFKVDSLKFWDVELGKYDTLTSCDGGFFSLSYKL